MTVMMKEYISSYKDLPAYPYDIMTVFRNEARAKSGVMRGREFFWKALYSFSKDEHQHLEFYEKIKVAYINVFNRVGIGASTYFTFASGGSFSKYSHEFQTISEAGEDSIYVDTEKKIAINKEVFTDEVISDLGLDKNNLKEMKAIEVGNIFSLGEKFSNPLELKYKNEKGEEKNVYMGSYGIGISRLVGTIAETVSDERGLVWPESVAPFHIHLISLDKNDEAQRIYDGLQKAGVEVLFDDRDARAGEKFADSDLIGIPHRIVVSSRSIDAGGVEYKKRTEKEGKIMSFEEIIQMFQK